jgi:hypothetical protein
MACLLEVPAEHCLPLRCMTHGTSSNAVGLLHAQRVPEGAPADDIEADVHIALLPEDGRS